MGWHGASLHMNATELQGPRRWRPSSVPHVDDDDAVQATIQLLLERAGHGVMLADDGRKGTGRAGAHRSQESRAAVNTIRIRSAALRAPSFFMMLARWSSMVRGLMPS